MFDALILRACSAQPLNLGELAETLFFYREVHITTDRGVLKQLLQDIGPDLLQVLLSEFHLKITHFDDGFGIWTYAAGSAAERYAPSIYTIPDIAFEKTFQQDIEQVTGRRGYSRRMAQRLSN
jgi:hypothetical protein